MRRSARRSRNDSPRVGCLRSSTGIYEPSSKSSLAQPERARNGEAPARCGLRLASENDGKRMLRRAVAGLTWLGPLVHLRLLNCGHLPPPKIGGETSVYTINSA